MKQCTYMNSGVRYVKSGEFRNPRQDEIYLSVSQTALRRVDNDGRPGDGAPDQSGGCRHILVPIGSPGQTHSPRATETKRVEAEPVTTPTKLWEIRDGLTPLDSDATATVGFGRPNIEGGPGIRIELLSILTTGEHHKDRHIVSKNLHPDLAEALGQAMIEAAQQARQGQAPETKRSAE